jgi:hypothetical protein
MGPPEQEIPVVSELQLEYGLKKYSGTLLPSLHYVLQSYENRAIHLTQPTTTCSIGADDRRSFLMLL